MTQAATLWFRTHFHSQELSTLELPVMVRDKDLRIVARTLTTKPLQLEPGDYYISCRLPAGQELQAHVSLAEGQTQVVDLAPDSADASPSENLEVQHFLRKSVRTKATRSPELYVQLDQSQSVTSSIAMSNARGADLGGLLATAGGTVPTWQGYSTVSEVLASGAVAKMPAIRLGTVDADDFVQGLQPTPASLVIRWFSGNALQSVSLLASDEPLRNPNVPLTLSLPNALLATAQPIICQLLVAGRPGLNVLVPMPPAGPAPAITLISSESDPSTYRIGIRLSHATADLLTRYLTHGMFQEACESLTSDSMNAELLLEAKSQDPIAAAVGAYTILRAGELERLHGWTTNLMSLFEWLPDGAAICGEHYARLGNHKDALGAFLQLQTRGLPFFADGLSYAIDRLRLYAKASTGSNPFSDADIVAGNALLTKLNSFATFTDFSRPLLTYSASDPSAPDDKPSILEAPCVPALATVASGTESFSSTMGSEIMADAVAPNSDTQFVFNGINGATGEYLEPPKTARQLLVLALSDPSFGVGAAGEVAAAHLKDLNRRKILSGMEAYGVRYGVLPDSVATAGWGVIFPRAADPSIADALRPLLNLRKNQAGKLYKEFIKDSGYADGDNKDDFLTRQGMGPGQSDPEVVPYYLLIVGDPETVPYQFQYQLDVEYAVGRIWFETLDEYARYAESVVLAETGKLALPRNAVMFGPQHPGDGATQLSSQQLILPLASWATKRGAAGQWQVDAVVGPDATRSRLGEYLGGVKTPALLFTASHGMGFPLGDNRQAAYQGALLCQDWPGPTYNGVDRSHYFAAEDVPDTAKLAGLISFHFACYGAGTPKLDDFAHQQLRKPDAIAPNAFVASLPRRLLAHPAGGALAVIGHVERAWGCSIVWKDAGRQIQAYQDVIAALMDGKPVGYALESINQRYADLSSSLSADLLDLRNGTKQLDEVALAVAWTANNDARSHVIIGDPAVRLAVAAAGQPAIPRTTIDSVRYSPTPTTPTPPAESPTIPRSIENQAMKPEPQVTPIDVGPDANSTSVTVTFPLQITVSVALGQQSQNANARAAESVVATPAPVGEQSFAVEIDPDYDDREGYDPTFLGTGTRRVPLPRLSAVQLADAAVVNNRDGDDRNELRYHHYSVVLNGKRRLAFFTAVNIDGTLAAKPNRETDKWAYDPRVARSKQVGSELYSSNPFDQGHLVRRLDPAWGRTDTIIKRANDDTFHFTNCSPQHQDFNRGKNLWAGLEDYLLNKAADEDRRMTVFTGPVFTAGDPKYRDVLIPLRYWKVAVVARPNGRLATLGFVVDQADLVREVVSFDATQVAKTYQVPVSKIEQATGLNFGELADVDAGSVESFAIGGLPERVLTAFEDIVLPKKVENVTKTDLPSFAPASLSPLPPETVDGTSLRYYLVAYDENGREREDHPAGIISRLAEQAIADPAATDVVLFSHGWMGDVKSAREQYTNWIRAMSANDADRSRAIQTRPGFKPVLVGIHWPSLPWGDEQLGAAASSVSVAFGPGLRLQTIPSIASDVENYAARMGDSPEARERIRTPLRSVLEKVAVSADSQPTLPPELREAYRQLDAAIGLGAKGVGSDPSSDREPFDPESVYQQFRLSNLISGKDAVAFSIFPSKDALLAPLRALSYWKMKDRARTMGEGPAHDLLVRFQQVAAGRNVRFHLVGHSFGCIVASGAVAGPVGSVQLPQAVDSLTLLQGAVSLWSYCANIPYVAGAPGYFHRLLAERRIRGPIVTTRSIYDRAVGTWYPLSSQVNKSVAFDVPGTLPKYGGIGSYGIRGDDLGAKDLRIGDIGISYALDVHGAITNVEASDVIRNGGGFSGAHSDICHPEVAHLVWSAMLT